MKYNASFTALACWLAPLGAPLLLTTEPALAQVSASELDASSTQPPSTTASDSAAPDSAPAPNDVPSEESSAASDTSSTTQPPPEPVAPVIAEATTPPLTEEPASPPLHEEPTAEATASISDEELESLLQKPPSPFDQGRLRVGVGLGWTSSTESDWLILGAGLGYYLIDGLEVAVDSTFWVIGDPFVATLTPGIRYVFVQLPTVKPYVGAFYRHYFVGDGWSDTDSIGGRLGVNFMLSKSAYLGGGIVYEHFVDDDLFASRDQFYPEITFAFSF